MALKLTNFRDFLQNDCNITLLLSSFRYSNLTNDDIPMHNLRNKIIIY